MKCKKIKYKSKEEAQKNADLLNMDVVNKHLKIWHDAYKCEFCGKHHVTTKRSGLTKAKLKRAKEKKDAIIDEVIYWHSKFKEPKRKKPKHKL